MLKKILFTLIIFTGLSAYAGDNFLNSVVIDNNDGDMSVILRSDEVTKVKKEVESSDKVILTLKGIAQSPNINTLYKNARDVNGLIIQNDGNNDLKVYIEAPNIAKADIIFDTPNSAPITVSDSTDEERVLWSVISIAILLLVMRSAKNICTEPPKKDINEIIKEREKALYRNFQKEVAAMPSIGYKLKAYNKHVIKGETLRSYSTYTKF
uniref:hypothetical protein n=1 Tax=Candidatus Stercorousia sp. TaxID=3048886 RepID=UPI00402A30CF